MNKNIDVLRSIVGSGDKNTEVDVDQALQTQDIKEADSYIQSLSHLSQDKQFSKWTEWSKDKNINPDFKWAKDEELYTGTDFRSKVKKEIDFELKVARSKQDKYDFFQRELSKWPTWLQDEYKTQASNSLPYKNQRELSDARKNNKIATREMGGVLSERLVGLSGNKSIKAHTDDLYRALSLDYEPQALHVNEEGHIAVSVEGKMTPVFALDEETYPKNAPMEDFILKRDMYGILEETISPLVTASQRDMASANRAKNSMLYRKLEEDTHGDLEEFELDIIYNASEDELDPDREMIKGLETITKRDLHKFASPFDAVASYIQKTKNLADLIDRRNLNG